MKKVSQLKMGIILSYISTALSMIINFVYTPLMIRLLGQSEYGLYTLVSSVVSYLSLFSFGFNGSYLRFYSKYKSNNDNIGEARLNGLFLLIFIFMGILSLICGLILAQFTPQIFGDKLSIAELCKAKLLMQILVVNISLTFPYTIFDSIICSREKFVFQRIVNILGVIFNPLICLPLLILGFDSVAIVVVVTLITMFKFIVCLYYCLKKIKAKFIFTNFDFSLFKEIGVFSFFIFLNMIMDQLNWSVDKFILGRVSGTNEVGVYGVGATINSVIMTLSNVISSVFVPRVNMIENEKISLKEKNKKISELLVKVGRIQFIVILYVFLGFVFAGRSFINWWVGSEYYSSYFVSLFLMLPLTLILPHSLGVSISRAKNMHKEVAVVLFLSSIINCFISVPLAIKFGASGSALGTFCSVALETIYLDYYYSKKCGLDIKLLYKNIFSIFKCLFFVILFGISGLVFNSFIINILWAIIYTILYFVFLYKNGLNDDEIKNFDGILKRLRKYN